MTDTEYAALVVELTAQLSVFMLVGGLLLGAGIWLARNILDLGLSSILGLIDAYRSPARAAERQERLELRARHDLAL
jgi:uncharacterized membrane protein